jgi:diaminopimelate decarboxylase
LNRARPFAYRKRALCVDEVPLAELAAAHGTPLYVYSESHLLGRLEMFERAFAGVEHTVCFAVKANSSLAILKGLARAGAGFDIVSAGELARVERAAPGAVGRTVFAGVGKQFWEIDRALGAGILLFNVESAEELELIAARAETLGKVARVSLRVNPDVFAETHPYISTGLSAHKFGIDINLARGLYRRAKRSKWVEAVGVSVHIGSQIRAVDPFGAAMRRVRTLVEELREDGIGLRYLDAGGGLGVEYGDAAFDAEAAVAGYAREILGATEGLGMHLLLEPGRFLVAQAGCLLTTVLGVKRNGEKTFVITDAGMNDLIRPALYQAHHEIWPLKQPVGSHTSVVDIVGPVCESGDFFARDRVLPTVNEGDVLAILDAGAYGMTLASNYNSRPRPAEVLVHGRKKRVVRKRETEKEMFAGEKL